MYTLPRSLVGDNGISKKYFQTKHSKKIIARVDDNRIFIEDSSKNIITSIRQVTSKDITFSPSSLLPIYHEQLDRVKAKVVMKAQTTDITKYLEQAIVREVFNGSVIDKKSIPEYIKSHHKIGMQKAITTIHSETIITNIAGTGNLIDESYTYTLSNRKLKIKGLETLSRSIFLLDNKHPDQVKANADILNNGIDTDRQLVPTTIREVIYDNVITTRSIVAHVHSKLKIENKIDFQHNQSTNCLARVMNNPLSLADDISPCRIKNFNEQQSIKSRMIVDIDVDSQHGT